jgi:hypothetical protein
MNPYPQLKAKQQHAAPVAILSESWNGGSKDSPVTSIALTHEMITPLAAFLLLESAGRDCWIIGRAVGIKPGDTHTDEKHLRKLHEVPPQQRSPLRGGPDGEMPAISAEDTFHDVVARVE